MCAALDVNSPLSLSLVLIRCRTIRAIIALAATRSQSEDRHICVKRCSTLRPCIFSGHPQTSRYSSPWTRNGQKANRVLCLHDRCREQVSEPLLRWPILLHWRTFRLWTWILPAYSVRNNQSLFDFLGRHFYGDLLSYFFLLPHI